MWRWHEVRRYARSRTLTRTHTRTHTKRTRKQKRCADYGGLEQRRKGGGFSNLSPITRKEKRQRETQQSCSANATQCRDLLCARCDVVWCVMRMESEGHETKAKAILFLLFGLTHTLPSRVISHAPVYTRKQETTQAVFSKGQHLHSMNCTVRLQRCAGTVPECWDTILHTVIV